MRFTFDLALDRDLYACLVQICGQCAFCATFQHKGKGHNFNREYLLVTNSGYDIYLCLYPFLSTKSDFKVSVIRKKFNLIVLMQRANWEEYHQILTSSRQRSEQLD